MNAKRPLARAGRIALLVLPMFLSADYILAHCDSLDGPVVNAAEKALATGDVNLVLIWVKPADEEEVRRTFQQALAIRGLGSEARSVADRHFFETLVRLHRAGEGAPYTGLKPAGRDLGPAIPAADQAIETGDLDELEELLTQEVLAGLRSHFAELREKRGYDPDDVDAGREYVESYVKFIHYAEGIHASATGEVEGHYAEP